MFPSALIIHINVNILNKLIPVLNQASERFRNVIWTLSYCMDIESDCQHGTRVECLIMANKNDAARAPLVFNGIMWSQTAEPPL